MDFSILRCFVTVVDTSSFTAAADRLFISQPALSGKIKKLEQELGVQLLERTTRHISLTDKGEIFYRHALSILQAEQGLLQELGIPLRSLTGHLNIWYSPMVVHEIAGLFAHLSKAFPLISIDYSQEDSEEIVFSTNPDYDFAFIPQYIFANNAQLQYIQIMEAQYCAVLPVSHPLSGEDSLRIEDLKGLTLLLIGTPGMRTLEDSMVSALRKEGGNPSRIKYSKNRFSLEIMVAAGSGYAILPSNMAQYAPKDLCYIPINDFPIEADRVCVWRKDNNNPILPAIIKEIHAWKRTLLK